MELCMRSETLLVSLQTTWWFWMQVCSSRDWWQRQWSPRRLAMETGEKPNERPAGVLKWKKKMCMKVERTIYPQEEVVSKKFSKSYKECSYNLWLDIREILHCRDGALGSFWSSWSKWSKPGKLSANPVVSTGLQRPDILPVPFLTSQLTLVCLSSNNTEHLRSGCHLSEDGVLNLPACVVGVFHVGKDHFKHNSAVK